MADATFGNITAAGRATVTTVHADGSGTLTPIGGGDPLPFAQAAIVAFRSPEWRRWPSRAAARLDVGETVAYAVTNGSIAVVGPWSEV